MSDTITIYSPVFTIHFEDPNYSELHTVPAMCLAEADAVVALRNAILKRLQEHVDLSDAEVKRIQSASSVKELALVFDIKSCAEIVSLSLEEKKEYVNKNPSNICYEHTVWVDFKINKQSIQLPPGKVLVAQSLCDKFDSFVAQFGFQADWDNDDPSCVKRQRIN